MLFATLLAANIGGGSTVGAAGLGYQFGLSAWWWVGAAGLGQLILAFTLGPRIRRCREIAKLRDGRLRLRGIPRDARSRQHARNRCGGPGREQRFVAALQRVQEYAEGA